MMLDTISFVIFLTACYLSYAEQVFRNFSCVTNNWNINLTCDWTEPTGYGSGLTTSITWTFGNQKPSNCPSSTRSSCTWGLGGNGQSYDIDPDRHISICLQLITHNGVNVSREECHGIDIANEVKPAAVSSIKAVSTSPLCLDITWAHENTLDEKTFTLQLSSDRNNVTYEINSTEDPSSGYYYHVCNLTYNTNYTISVKTRPLNYDGLPTGYWSILSTTHKVTPKSVPSRPPELLPGAYTFGPVNIRGYRTTTVYWSALPRYSWNGENSSYVIRVSPMKPCRQQTLHLQQVEAFCKFKILSNCSYHIFVWSKNEIGRSGESSKMHIEDKGLNLPQDIFINAKIYSEEVEISWKPHAMANLMTVYWCEVNPARSCSSGFYHKTVSSRHNSTSVYLKGFSEEAYIFGVSAESKQHGKIVSSGFQWTDCSTILPRVFRSPRIHFRGFPKEEMVAVSWAYSYCNNLILKELRHRTNYQVKISTSTQRYNQLLKGNASFVNLYNIPSGVEVCVSITARLNHSSQLASPFTCYTQGQDGGSKFPVNTIALVLCSIIGLFAVMLLACITRKICIWWRRKIPIYLPNITGASETFI
ncbi:uncharacterized protein LOC110451016 [Mizuhopecten yessoensis]|uniref:uncharacterized protein LOC110451016 n=1 Tax=Mizuhopecten yessoensis TaxID=6573 RepID=UPI000B4581B9|nr:uncharacterized protein LOC110451016 [Mizuhopecten yessoensis]